MQGKNIYLISAILFLTAVFLFQCDEDEMEPRNYSRIDIKDNIIQREDGITFTGKIISKGELEIYERGFIWSVSSEPTIDYSPRISAKESDNDEEFRLTVKYDYCKGTTYRVRAFIRDSNYLVYSRTIEFECAYNPPAPVITNFFPGQGKWGDTIRIQGRHFSFLRSALKVLFGEVNSQIISSSDSTILVKVPDIINNDSVNLKVSVYDSSCISDEKFRYIIPQILDYLPKHGTFNDTITISGIDFPLYSGSCKVEMDGVSADIIMKSSTEIKALVPPELATPESEISVTISGTCKVFPGKFSLLPPVIIDFSPGTGSMTNRIIAIAGRNFNPEPALNLVKLGSYPVQVKSASSNELGIEIPNEIVEGKYEIFVTAGGMTCTLEKEISIVSPWTKKANFGGQGRWRAVGFSIGNKGYIGTGNTYNYQFGSDNQKDFWEYDAENDTWIQKANFGGIARQNAAGFSIGDLGYIGPAGYEYYEDYRDMWEYNPETNVWTKKTDYPGWSIYLPAVGFSGSDYGYIFVGNYDKDLWKYDPASDSWMQKGSLPTTGHRWEAAGFTINGKLYVCTGWDGNTWTLKNDLWEYDPSGNTWTKKANFPGGARMGAIGFSVNGKGYVGLGAMQDEKIMNDFWEYDPLTDSWKRIFNFSGGPRRNAISFNMNGKAYIGTGLNENYRVTDDFWEFDPAKE